MKIALLGASGMISQRVTMEALARGHEVGENCSFPGLTGRGSATSLP